MSDRKEELKRKRREHQQSLTDINNWLLKHFDHPDRGKYFSDRAWHECEINRIDVKLRFLNAGQPENGYAAGIEPGNINQNLINKTTS